jgi:hypothetical protein
MASSHLAGNFLKNSGAKSKIFKSYSRRRCWQTTSAWCCISFVQDWAFLGGTLFLPQWHSEKWFLCHRFIPSKGRNHTTDHGIHKIHNLAMTSFSGEARILKGGIAGLHMLAFVKSKSQATTFFTTKTASHLSGPAEQDPFFSRSLSLGWRHSTIISSLKAVTSAKERIFPIDGFRLFASPRQAMVSDNLKVILFLTKKFACMSLDHQISILTLLRLKLLEIHWSRHICCAQISSIVVQSSLDTLMYGPLSQSAMSFSLSASIAVCFRKACHSEDNAMLVIS